MAQKKTRTISSILKTHPVSLYDNLAKISNALGIEIVDTQKPTKAKMQSDIEECVKTYPDYEQTVRDLANEYIVQDKELKSSTDNNPQSQADLFEESLIMETEESSSQSMPALPKRKFTEDMNDADNEPKIRLVLNSELNSEFKKLTNVLETLVDRVGKLENQIATFKNRGTI